MFDFILGGKRKLKLISEHLEQRMREQGFDDMDSRLVLLRIYLPLGFVPFNLKKSVEFNPAKNIQHKLDKIFSITACI